MEPIVSPWTIYWIGVLPNLQLFGFFVALAILFALVFLVTGWVMEKDALCRRITIVLLPFLIPSSAVGIFIPSRETLICMCIAQHITTDRVDKAMDSGKDIHDLIKQDIADLIRQIKDPNAK